MQTTAARCPTLQPGLLGSPLTISEMRFPTEAMYHTRAIGMSHLQFLSGLITNITSYHALDSSRGHTDLVVPRYTSLGFSLPRQTAEVVLMK